MASWTILVRGGHGGWAAHRRHAERAWRSTAWSGGARRRDVTVWALRQPAAGRSTC